jgi:hypothetical protein
LVVTDIQSLCKRDDAIVRAFTTHCLSFLIQNMQDKNNVASQKYHQFLFDVNKNYRELNNYSLDSIKDFLFIETAIIDNGMERSDNGVDGVKNLESPENFLGLVVGYLIKDFLASEVCSSNLFSSRIISVGNVPNYGF